VVSSQRPAFLSCAQTETAMAIGQQTNVRATRVLRIIFHGSRRLCRRLVSELTTEDGEDEKHGSNGGSWMYNRWWPGGQDESPG
jgi:hypothetical protein